MGEPTKLGSERLLELFESMDASLKAINGGIQSLVRFSQQRTQQAKQNQPKRIATDAELDSRNGDQVIRSDPRDWTGPSMKGRRMSQCSAEFLEQYAEMKDYFERKKLADPDEAIKKKAVYEERDAARARGWARRAKAAGRTGPAAPTQEAAEDTDGWARDEDDTADAGATTETPDEGEIEW